MLTALGLAGHCRAQSTLQGTVIDRANRPIPGLQVSVANLSVGRSRTAYTDAQGHYALAEIPASPQPYSLEVYWGTRLVHSERVTAAGRGNLPLCEQVRCLSLDGSR